MNEPQWKPIETYKKPDKFTGSKDLLVCHSKSRWIRFGRYYPEVGKWYYSGTNERSMYSQVEGGEPTHYMELPSLPEWEL